MPDGQKQNAGPKAGVASVDLAGGLEATEQKARAQSSTDSAILSSKSTETGVQRAKVLALLRVGPKTTVELRQHGIMMPATRVFELKRDYKHEIVTELVPLYDAEGIRHNKCARYHLVPPAPNEEQVNTTHDSMSQVSDGGGASSAGRGAIAADYAFYEARKAEWIAQHPDASGDQYQAAISAIAKDCGV